MTVNAVQEIRDIDRQQRRPDGELSLLSSLSRPSTLAGPIGAKRVPDLDNARMKMSETVPDHN